MPKIIIGLVGEISSGKGTAAKYLEEKYGATNCRFSTALRDVLNRLYTDVSRHNMQVLSLALRNTFGQDILAKIIAHDAQAATTDVVVIDGIRRPADITYLKDLPEFAFVYITADMRLRYDRIITRGENTDDNQKTFEQFQKDHEVETELEIPRLGASAEYRINNDGSLEDLYQNIDKIINKK